MDTTTTRTVTWLGTTDEVTTCDCCGKKNLKGTVALSINDANPVYYGCTCAARAIGRTVKEVRSESKKIDNLRARAERARKDEEFGHYMKAWTSFLDRAAGVIPDGCGGSDMQKQFAVLGGYTAAREMFEREVA